MTIMTQMSTRPSRSGKVNSLNGLGDSTPTDSTFRFSPVCCRRPMVE